MGSLSIWHWLIVLLIVVLVFGTKKLRNMGGDVGGAVKSFKDAMNEEKNATSPDVLDGNHDSNLIEANATELPVENPAPKKKPVAKKPGIKKVAVSKATAKPKATTSKIK